MTDIVTDRRRLPAAVLALLGSSTLMGATLAGPALAAPAPAGPLAITTQLMVEQRHAAPDGTTRIVLAKPARVGPGDRIVVVVGYRNIGTQPLGNVVLADPLPPSVTYRGPHAGSPEPEVSVDGHSFTTLAALPATAGRPARADDVTAVRWRLPAPLAPGGQGQFAFQGTLK